MSTPPESDLTGALHIATQLTEARSRGSRILADPRERELAGELIARISARVATSTGQATPTIAPTAGSAGTTTDTAKRMFTTSEVAEQLGVSPKEVRRLINTGRLRTRRNGRYYLVPASAIDEWLDGRDDPLAAS